MLQVGPGLCQALMDHHHRCAPQPVAPMPDSWMLATYSSKTEKSQDSAHGPNLLSTCSCLVCSLTHNIPMRASRIIINDSSHCLLPHACWDLIEKNPSKHSYLLVDHNMRNYVCLVCIKTITLALQFLKALFVEIF